MSGPAIVHRANVCWHCLDVLADERPRCERCPSECDDADCKAPACNGESVPPDPLRPEIERLCEEWESRLGYWNPSTRTGFEMAIEQLRAALAKTEPKGMR